MPIIIILLYLILCVIFPLALIAIPIGLALWIAIPLLAVLMHLVVLPFLVVGRLFRRKPAPTNVAPAPVPAPSEAKTPKGDALGLALEWFGKGAGVLLVLALGVALVSAVVGGP